MANQAIVWLNDHMVSAEHEALRDTVRQMLRHKATSGLGNLGLSEARARLRRARTWGIRERRRFDRALRRLAGRSALRPYRRTAIPS